MGCVIEAAIFDESDENDEYFSDNEKLGSEKLQHSLKNNDNTDNRSILFNDFGNENYDFFRIDESDYISDDDNSNGNDRKRKNRVKNKTWKKFDWTKIQTFISNEIKRKKKNQRIRFTISINVINMTLKEFEQKITNNIFMKIIYKSSMSSFIILDKIDNVNIDHDFNWILNIKEIQKEPKITTMALNHFTMSQNYKKETKDEKNLIHEEDEEEEGEESEESEDEEDEGENKDGIVVFNDPIIEENKVSIEETIESSV